jgi:chaperone required for assembly of F1-ATPase
MKRFYKLATVVADADGFAVALDGRPLRTPGKRKLVVARRGLADAIAEEWNGQGDTVAPAGMRITRLVNTATDHVGAHRDDVRQAVARFAETDLVCYRAEGPADLAARQAGAWQPLLDWLAERYGVALTVVNAMLPATQPQPALTRLAAAVADYDDISLTALHSATAACGSLVLGLALAERRIDAEAAWAASVLDESWQIEQWGVDGEAERRRELLRLDIGAAARVLDLCRG